MIWTVSLRSRAERDLTDAMRWYEEQRTGLGFEFLTAIDDTLGKLEREPQRARVYYRGFRRCLVQRFPCKNFYRTEAPHVIVFRVLHAKQNHLRELG